MLTGSAVGPADIVDWKIRLPRIMSAIVVGWGLSLSGLGIQSLLKNPLGLPSILGVNGAGKSTLLKCLNRILHPPAGSVLLGEENLLKLSQDAIARRMGYAPQQHNPPRLTAY